MAPRKRLYKLEDAVEMVFADSPSEDEDLLQPQSDPDYEFRESRAARGSADSAYSIAERGHPCRTDLPNLNTL
ncbi:hypothetical protein NQZ68_042368, partial [Dissostichus eleginoides]